MVELCFVPSSAELVVALVVALVLVLVLVPLALAACVLECSCRKLVVELALVLVVPAVRVLPMRLVWELLRQAPDLPICL